MKNSKKVLIFTLISVLLLSVTACGAIEGGTGENGEEQQQPPVQLPVEDQEPQEPAPTQPPPEPEPTQAPPQQQPTQQEPLQPETTQAPDSGSSEDLIRALLIILVVVIVLGAFIWIISLFTGSRDKKAEPAPAPVPVQEQQPSEPVTENTLLKNASPEVTNMYNRFVDLVKAIGPVSILPTQTRIDFQARTIFASVYFKLESLEIQMVLPTIVQDARIIRVDTISSDKYAHNIMIKSLDDYDAQFNAWLQEAYDLGSRTM
jgi:flagellar basal body-associated protein FliL